MDASEMNVSKEESILDQLYGKLGILKGIVIWIQEKNLR